MSKTHYDAPRSFGSRLLSFLLMLAVIALCVYGIWQQAITRMWATRYAVQGVDLSHYQGNVNFQSLVSKDIDFVYMKATEAGDWVDPKFAENRKNADEAGMLWGAYHFFDYNTPPSLQIQNYLDVVGEDLTGHLIPVIDAEFTSKTQKKDPPDKVRMQAALQEVLNTFEQKYDVKPMIYTTTDFYHAYMEDGDFDDYPLWIRSVYLPPSMVGVGDYDFWQYTSMAKMDSYSGGEEPHIDRDIYTGTTRNLSKYIIGGEEK